MRNLFLGIVLAIGATGCGKKEQSEIPKNPVPMEQPGASIQPGGGKAGGAAPAAKPQPLP